MVDNSGRTTDAMTAMNVAESPLRVDELILGAKTNVGFTSRPTMLFAQIGLLSGNVDSTFSVPEYTNLSLATMAGQTSLVLLHNVFVASGASVHLPKSVSIEDSGRLEALGIITGVRDIAISNGGVLKLAPPVSIASDEKGVVSLNVLRVDYDGSLEHSSRGTDSGKVTLSVTELQTAPQFTLDTRYFDVPQNARRVTLYRDESPLNHTCVADDDGDLHLFRTQSCYIANGTHTFRDIIIDSGAELRLEGDPSGVELTKVISELVHIHPGGVVTGAATGFESNGPGSGQTVGEAGSLGGLGGNVEHTSRLYGDMVEPRQYGSNGFKGGRGGGQLEFVVTKSFINSGSVNVNGEDSDEAGGSGVLSEAEAVEEAEEFH
ncbi:hypothetical protein NP493_4023g00001 [Ridgeia piscesae]|uniref:Uncharacterized protein n=1 Tax=Ridgeia piscesae TaxID=27915 RepID=A0AAD9MTS4_RIDPI|nr:hypothetical protein NP493_4023g00001 [Ridgeia piscesae]